MNMVALLLPGVAVTYYGEEIGMEDVKLSWQETVDPAGRNAGPERYIQHSRDPQRSPMQWSDQQNAGNESN
jgi:alpha-glucosidase